MTPAVTIRGEKPSVSIENTSVWPLPHDRGLRPIWPSRRSITSDHSIVSDGSVDGRARSPSCVSARSANGVRLIRK